MADKIPLKVLLLAGDTTSLSEFNPGDSVPISFGGTGANDVTTAKTNFGLGNVDNTSDLNKPVSTAQASAISSAANTAESNAKAASTPIAHVGTTGTSHGAATTSINGFMSAADKIKLDAISGTNTGDQTNITGNAGTATKLQTARNINGVSFDGSADITIADSTKAVKGANSDITSLSGLTTALTVTQGGTGRNTGTTAYGLITAGTTAAGAQQTLAAGLTTQILVGGGASALPVWTATTGSGSPVRATSPTLVTPNIGVASGTSFNSITGLSSTTPAMDGTAAVGTGTTTARGDHRHPTDTSRAALATSVQKTSNTGAAIIPTGATADRPTPVEGHFRRNSELGQWEGYDGSQWSGIGGASVVGKGPAFSASGAGGAVLGAVAKIGGLAEEFDTDNNFSSSRFTPSTPGYYQVSGYMVCTSVTQGSLFGVRVHKNDEMILLGSLVGNAAATVLVQGISIVSGIVYLNGTTDYIELWANAQGSLGAGAVKFQGFLARAA